MSSYKNLKIYQIAFDLSIRIHKASLKLPKFELYEQGSQIRRSSKTIKDTIAEGYGRRRYKQEYIKYLVYAISSCDEVNSQLETIICLYEYLKEFPVLLKEYDELGKKINKYLQWVELNWNLPRTQYPVPSTQNPEPSTQNPVPRTQNPVPRTY